MCIRDSLRPKRNNSNLISSSSLPITHSHRKIMTTQAEITMAPEILMVGITVERVMATRELERVEAVKSLLFSEGFRAR